MLYHCPELREIQYNAIKSFRDSTFDDLLSQSINIEDENDINIFYTNVLNKECEIDLFRNDENSDKDSSHW